jgi:hypothetical protein
MNFDVSIFQVRQLRGEIEAENERRHGVVVGEVVRVGPDVGHGCEMAGVLGTVMPPSSYVDVVEGDILLGI